MNILQITSDYIPKPLWGMGWHVYDLTRGLVKYYPSLKVYVVTANKSKNIGSNIITTSRETDRQLLSDKQDEIFSDFDKFIRWNRELVSQIKSFLKNREIHIIHCHNWMSWITTREIAIFTKSKVVSSLHFLQRQYEYMIDNPVPQNHNDIIKIELEMLNNSDGIVCFSEKQREFLRDKYGFINGNIRVITHSAEIANVHNKVNKKHRGIIKIVFVGRLEEDKGVIKLAQVFKELERFYPNIYLDIIGDGKLVSDLKNLGLKSAKIWGLQNRDKVFEILSGADIFCLPSNSETFGLSVIEAMHHSLVPLFPTGNYMPKLFKDNISGLTLQTERVGGHYEVNKEDLRHKLEYLITNPQDRDRIGNEAKKYAEKHYSYQAMIEKTYYFYKSILENN